MERTAGRLVTQLNGDVIGTLRHLERVAVSTQARGVLLDADWASVAGIGADIRLPQRESKLDDFLEPGGGRDQLNLVLIPEHSLHVWEMLRVAGVRQTEPEHLESAIADSRGSLAQERQRNEELVVAVMSCVDELRAIRVRPLHDL